MFCAESGNREQTKDSNAVRNGSEYISLLKQTTYIQRIVSTEIQRLNLTEIKSIHVVFQTDGHLMNL